MVTEPRSRDTRNGYGVTGRFRPLGASGETPDPAPPEFATAPWGYRRAEVDAWASWVAGLVAHGRSETVRADSAEATLRATLDRLEQLERSAPREATTGDPGDLPRRGAPEPAQPPPETPASDPSREGGPDRDAARLQVVETTLREVMRLLHRLVGPEQPASDRDGP